MSRRKLPTAIVLAAIGISLITCVQADEYVQPYAMAPTVTSTTINGKEILIDVPVGKVINMPAGTRLWPASPIVISDGPVAEYRSTGIPTTNVAETPNQTTRVFTIKYSNHADGYVSNPNVINPSQYADVIATEEVVIPTTRPDPTRLIVNTDSTDDSKAAERVDTSSFAENAATDDVDVTSGLTWSATDDSITTNMETPRAAETTNAAETTDAVETNETDIATVTIPSDDETADVIDEFQAESNAPENDVDLYADSFEPPYSDESESITEFTANADIQDDNETTAFFTTKSNDQSVESNDEQAGRIQIVFDGELEDTEDTSFAADEPTSTTIETVANQAADDAYATKLAPDQIPMPVFATEQQATKSELPWLLPFVFFSAIGLAWAERLRRNRAKARFARAMEHGRRVQRPDEEDLPGMPALSATEQPIPANTVAYETADEPTATTATKHVANPLPPMTTVNPVETTTPLVHLETTIDEITSPALEVEADQEWATNYDETPVISANDDIAFVDTQPENTILHEMDIIETAGEAIEETPSDSQSEPVNQVVIEQSIQQPVAQQPTGQAATPQPTEVVQNNEQWLQKMRDADGNAVEEDLELDQLTGLLEDANAMRSEWAGFEKRAVDFRDRWADREQQRAEANQQANND